MDFPYYTFENGELVRKGTFKDNREFTTNLYNNLSNLNIIKYFNLNFPLPTKSDVELVFEIIKKSKEIYETKLNGKFYVLIHPLEEPEYYSEYLEELLTKANIPIIKPQLNNDSSEYIIPYDGHPNKKLNEKVVEEIINYIKFN